MAISLSPEVEAKIREKVGSGGIESVEAFVDRVVRQALGIRRETVPAENGEGADEIDQEVDAFFAALDDNLPRDTPVLPDHAISRDAIYEGCG